MARAKHTDRTEARRRHRAEQAALAAAASGEAPEGNAPADSTAAKAPATRTSAGKAVAAPPAQRPGIMSAFRGAYRPVDLRSDLRAFPQVVTHWAVLASMAIAIVATIAFIVSTNEFGASLDVSVAQPLEGKEIGMVTNATYLVISLFVAPPPAAGAFLIGFTAQRASWLGGLVFGIVAAICYSVIVATPAGRLLIGGNPPEAFAVQAMVMGPIGALLFASMAAWYKRFLNLANPNRGARRANGKAQPKPKAKPATAKSGTRSR